jgi:hypothetical protein
VKAKRTEKESRRADKTMVKGSIQAKEMSVYGPQPGQSSVDPAFRAHLCIQTVSPKVRE